MAKTEKHSLNISKGIYYSFIAAFTFALMGAFVKIAGRSMSSVNIVLYRNIIGLVFILATIIKNPLKNNGGRFGLLMFRGLIGSLSLFALFYNMSHIGLGEAITYIQTSTIFVAIFSFLFLKEKLSIYGWLAVLLGFVGILFVFRPSFNTDLKTEFLGVFNGIAAGAAYTSVRALRKYYDTRSIVLSFMGWGTFLSLLFMLLTPFICIPGFDFLLSPFQVPRGITWLWIFFVGITALLGQIFLTKAYAEDQAGIISTIGYTNIPFAILIGIVLGDSFPDIITITGMALIITSGIVIAIRRNY